MKFSLPMKIVLGVVAVIVVLRVMTPSPEQQMIDQMNQQLQGQLVDPYQSGYSVPGYYQESTNYQNQGYQNQGYQNQYYNGNHAAYQQTNEVDYGPNDDEWQW